VESRRTGGVGGEEERTEAAGRKGGVIEGGGVEEDWRSRGRGAEDRSSRKKRRSNRGRWSRGGLEE
jgi:hypothetical protein